MSDWIDLIITRTNLSAEVLILAGIALAVLTLAFSVALILNDRSPAADRMAGIYEDRLRLRQNKGLLLSPDEEPRGAMKALLPVDGSRRSALRNKLMRAGYGSHDAMRKFMLIRAATALVLPGLFLVLLVLSRIPSVPLPAAISGLLSGMGSIETYVVLSFLVGVGYMIPLKILHGRIAERKRKIEEAFPNALDLLQVSVEAGLGFDAAMTRVGNELAQVSPEVSSEFLVTQRQIQAGRAREDALRDLAARADISAVNSFTTVVQQAMQYGTSLSEALITYSGELRTIRETNAQEMANKLPVKMSAVLAILMLPALILLSVGPTIIRYIEF